MHTANRKENSLRVQADAQIDLGEYKSASFSVSAGSSLLVNSDPKRNGPGEPACQRPRRCCCQCCLLLPPLSLPPPPPPPLLCLWSSYPALASPSSEQGPTSRPSPR